MSKSNSFENALLLLIFNNVNIANLGDATGVRGSAAAGNLYISLHTADPAEGGNQSSNEATYTSYARVAVARSGAAWVVTGDTAENAAVITMPKATGGSNTITHVGIGVAGSGAGQLLYSVALNAPIAVSNNIQPEFGAGDLTVTDD